MDPSQKVTAMHAIVLAGGLATRLRPLTDTIPKPLLPVGGRPMLDAIVDKLEAVPVIESVVVVATRQFEAAYRQWQQSRVSSTPIRILCNDVAGERDTLGPLRGGVMLSIDRAQLAGHDLMVISGDNVFEAPLGELVDDFEARGDATFISTHRFADAATAGHYGAVDVDPEGRLVQVLEAPRSERDVMAHVSIQILHRDHIELLREYLDAGQPAHRARPFLNWLARRAPVYARALPGVWIDAGTKDDLLRADNWARTQAGMPTREHYLPHR